MTTQVNTPSDAVTKMRKRWSLAKDLMGGTEAMREAGKRHLPQWPKEEDDAYASRLGASTLLPTFQRTVRVMSAKPFSKQLTVTDPHPIVEKHVKDIDRQGNTLHAFASEAFPRILANGLHGVLVEYTKVLPDPVEGEEAQPVPTLADAAGARPYFIAIDAWSVLGWRDESLDGIDSLSQLRLCEDAMVPDGEFGEALVERVRVLEPGGWRLFEKRSDAGDFIEVKRGISTFPGATIPFVPFYGVKEGFMLGKSPLLELGYLNVKHWQSQSDQDNILHVARVPILAAFGVGDEDTIVVGASVIKLDNAEADVKYVEHTGKAIEAGQASLDALEGQMLQIGAELLIKKPGGQRTATESNSEADANKSDLQRLVEQFEASLDRCLLFMAQWVDAGATSGGSAQLFKDFGAATLTDASAQIIISLATLGLIARETALKEMKRRGLLAADIDEAEELLKAKEEGPLLPAAPEPGDEGDDEGAGA
jgi:hypothetical protein